jgi:hypothetical protein
MGWGRRGVVIGGGDTIELFVCVDKGGGHAEVAHVLEHDAVVGSVESAYEVRVLDVDVFVVIFCVFHHHDDGGEGVVDAA